MQNRVRCAIIGSGIVSKFFISGVIKNKDAILVAVCDNDIKQLSHVPEGIMIYNSFDDMVNKEDIDVIIISLPNNLHYKFIKKAIYAGKHVLCEKPLVLNLEQAKKVFRLAKKKKVMLRTAFHRRFNKNMIRLINKSKTFGKIKRIEASYFEKIEDHSNKRRDYNHIRKYSDGCVIDNGTNMIDIFLHLLRNIKFTKAYIGYKKRGKNYLDDKATIYFSFKEGLIILKLDWSYSGEKKDMKIITTEGSINIDFLKDFKNFKSSLWHEYNSLFSEFLNHLKKGDFYEKNDLLVISLIDKIYHSKKTYKYRLYK